MISAIAPESTSEAGRGGDRRRSCAAAAPALLALAALVAAPGARAQEFAPVDAPRPPLSVPASDLAAALECGPGLDGAAVEPVLLVPGTTVTPEKNFSWNWIPALNALNRPWCTIELPGSSMADIQVAGEYVVGAIRTMHQRSGREIDVLGHSQGGMVPSNHGTLSSIPLCALGCSPAFWQQTRGSNFLNALNSRQETFAGVDYTAIYTVTDTIVTPNLDDSGSSSLHGGDGAITNVAIQDVCPTDLTEHLAMGTISNTTYRLAIDALDNPGPADPSRIPATTCLSPLMPGVNPATAATDLADAALYLATTTATYPHVPAEPALACYATASCPATGSGIAGESTKPKPKKKKRKKRRKRGGKRR